MWDAFACCAVTIQLSTITSSESVIILIAIDRLLGDLFLSVPGTYSYETGQGREGQGKCRSVCMKRRTYHSRFSREMLFLITVVRLVARLIVGVCYWV